MNRSRYTLTFLLTTICLLLSSGLLAGGSAFVSNGTGGGNYDDPTTWSPQGVPSFANGDTVEIVNGDVVLSSSTVDSARTVQVLDGTLIINNTFLVNRLVVDENGPGTLEAFDANIYFTGRNDAPATFSNMQGFSSIGSIFITGDTATPQLVSGGYLIFDDSFLTVLTRFLVGQNSIVEFRNESSMQFDGDFTDPLTYCYNGSELRYTGPGSLFFPFDEWRPGNTFLQPGQSPANVVIDEFVDVDMQTETGNFTIQNLSMFFNSTLRLPDNDAFVISTGDIFVDNEAVMTKFISDPQILDGGVPISFGATEIEIVFTPDSFIQFAGEGIEVRRLGNEGPASDTFTNESYDVEVVGVPSPPKGTQQPEGGIFIRSIEFTKNGFTFINQPVIFWRPIVFDFFEPLSTALTDDQPTTVTYTSLSEPTDLELPPFLFSSFFLNDGLINTVVELQDFAGSADGDIFIVRWNTASEIDNIGFNVYRGDVSGSNVVVGDQINQQMIRSLQNVQGEGAHYLVIDPVSGASGETRYYYLEDIDLNGSKTLHGPISITAE